MPPYFARRAFLGHTAAVGAAASFVSSAALGQRVDDLSQPVESRYLHYDDPAERFRDQFRLLRSLDDEADVLMWYEWTQFVVPEKGKVVPLNRYEGIEFSRHRRIGDALYRVHGHNLSYPRDLYSGAFIDTVVNPVTGETVTIPPTVLTEDPGMLYSPEGKRPLDRESDVFTEPYHFYRIEDDSVVCDEIRVPPDTWPTPFIETSQCWTPKDMFFDHSITRLPMGTAGSFVYPYPRWLKMGDDKGHMFGSWKGKKLEGAHRLPDEFRKRTEREYPALLQVDLSKFET